MSGSAIEEVHRLKQGRGKNLVLWGSLSLAESLMNEGLVDEYRLWVCAVLLGQGRRLLTNSDTQGMRWLETKPYGDSVVSLRFEPIGTSAGRAGPVLSGV